MKPTHIIGLALLGFLGYEIYKNHGLRKGFNEFKGHVGSKLSTLEKKVKDMTTNEPVSMDDVNSSFLGQDPYQINKRLDDGKTGKRKFDSRPVTTFGAGMTIFEQGY